MPCYVIWLQLHKNGGLSGRVSLLKLQVMNQLLHSVADTKQITAGTKMKLLAPNTRTTTEQAEQHVRENQRRATEIGPVLEGILQNHWRHWGLND